MQTQSKKLDFTGQKIFTSFDAHLKSWEITIMTGTLIHKTFSQPPWLYLTIIQSHTIF